MMGKRKNDGIWFGNYLQRDEEWQWIGRPNSRRILRWYDIFAIPAGVVLFLIALGFVSSVIEGAGLPGLVVLLVPHFWAVMWIFPGRFIYENLSRRNLTYVVTNRRLLIVNTLFGTHCKSYHIAQLPEFDIHARKNNTGTICFSGKPRYMSNQHWSQSNARTDFYDIPDVWKVYNLIQDIHHESQFMLVEEVEYEYYEEPRKLKATYQ